MSTRASALAVRRSAVADRASGAEAASDGDSRRSRNPGSRTPCGDCLAGGLPSRSTPYVGHLRIAARPGQREPVLQAFPQAVEGQPLQRRDPSSWLGCRKCSQEVRLEEHRHQVQRQQGLERSTRSPPSVTTASATPYTSRRQSCACKARSHASRLASPFSGRPMAHRPGSAAT